jgi:hypothetical protein
MTDKREVQALCFRLRGKESGLINCYYFNKICAFIFCLSISAIACFGEFVLSGFKTSPDIAKSSGASFPIGMYLLAALPAIQLIAAI